MNRTNHRLTLDDAVQVWLHSWTGEYQHEIAARFGVNQGRVNEVLKGKRHAGSEQIAREKRNIH
ncbi:MULTISPECIES: hypothetical protein [unclassified Rhizobium]|uniref:hypothetical protein n=1 Tax=unclassified Rhizobium TaxID=2613769 RepID=UPI001A9892CD|nr:MULTISPECIES: hypothetical protein [unclassified Rhizobium]MBX5196573.1 hypothetical protein [Rhizobium sp. NZLR10]MBX5200965.1 hypothetical protein [Rhizobium sp. NZLR1]QSZ21601.1 hypothetical protein J3O30_03255 [Rhizobium sp. NZLR1]